MKWYAFNDTEDSDTVDVILDHNTTATVRWSSTSSNNTNGDTVKAKLIEDTKTWNSSLKPRLIEANEIAKITGNTEFDASNKEKDNVFYLENNSQDEPSLSQGQAKYKWLFDYTSNCTDYGCSIADSSTDGYWTSTPDASDSRYAWYVYDFGRLSCNVIYANDTGVRPVITISKFLLS